MLERNNRFTLAEGICINSIKDLTIKGAELELLRNSAGEITAWGCRVVGFRESELGSWLLKEKDHHAVPQVSHLHASIFSVVATVIALKLCAYVH